MTNKQVIEHIKLLLDKTSNITLFNKMVFEKVIQALEKQVPQKPLAFRADYKCPICDKTFMFGNSIKPNYCKRCGQKLDWSGEDETNY